MPHSLKSRIKSLCYKGEITEKERDKIIKALEQQPKTETHGSTYGGVSWGGTYKPQQPNQCDSCIHSDERDGSNCYECVKGMADNFEAQPCEDCISRQGTIDVLWKALHEYENKTEKQFIDSEELDIADWIQHRVFVQNMSDIDRQMILNMPSVTPKARWIPVSERLPEEPGNYLVTMKQRGISFVDYIWYESGMTDNFWRNSSIIIAWMPLPQLYKAEGEE